MATEIIMPKLGMDMQEGTVVEWLKDVGDEVEKGEPILEILTDKVNMEVEAETSGTLLNIRAKEGDVLPVLTVIGYIGEPGEEIPAETDEKPPSEQQSTPSEIKVEEKLQEDVPVSKHGDNGKVRATPAARRLAREKGIDIVKVTGSGPQGRIQLADVEEFEIVRATPLARKIADSENIDLSEVKGTGAFGKITKDDLDVGKTIAPVAMASEAVTKPAEKIIPMVGMRKIIAERMKDSLDKSAPITLNIEADMTNANNFREKLKPILQKEINQKITLTDLIIMATTKALVKYPEVNSTLVEEGIRINDSVNMGVAVGLERGLIVPVIKGTDKMTLKDIVINRTDIVGRTVDNKVNPEELSGSTFTISNLGMFGTISFTSIINQPNSAILSVGTTVKRMRIINDEPQIRSVMNLSVTIDHRVMDGAKGAEFLQYLKDLLEDPSMMLL